MFVRVCLFPGQMYQIMASRDSKLFLIAFYDLILSPPNLPIKKRGNVMEIHYTSKLFGVVESVL